MKKKDDFVTFSVINNERCFVFCRVTSFLNECVRERERERMEIRVRETENERGGGSILTKVCEKVYKKVKEHKGTKENKS